MSHYKYIKNTKVQYKFDDKKPNIMCVQLNNACCFLCQAFEIKSATYFTNLLFIKRVIISIPDMTST